MVNVLSFILDPNIITSDTSDMIEEGVVTIFLSKGIHLNLKRNKMRTHSGFLGKSMMTTRFGLGEEVDKTLVEKFCLLFAL